MLTFERYDFSREYDLTPLISAFVSAHSDILNFDSNYASIFEKYIKDMKNKSSRVAFLAKDASKITGLIVGAVEENPPLLLPPKIGYIPILVVLPDCRRAGVGKSLFLALREWFAASGVTQIELYTGLENAAASAFWQSIGFQSFLERKRLVL